MNSSSDSPSGAGKIALPDLADRVRRGERLTVITAYDAPSARLADAAGIDIILVGDSAGTTVLGLDSTVPVTMDEMLVFTRAVSRTLKHRVGSQCWVNYNPARPDEAVLAPHTRRDVSAPAMGAAA